MELALSRHVYFYPHAYLRDRQLDTIRHWPKEEVLNLEIFSKRSGAKVSARYANARKLRLSWKQKIPLLNIKLRPIDVPKSAVVYIWGGLIAWGDFIVDLDNPWALVGFNINAMPLYRWVIKKILLSERCLEVRCMSKACRNSLKYLFGENVFHKATVHYPAAGIRATNIKVIDKKVCRFVFVGTQFEIKGGKALLSAFKLAQQKKPTIQLDIITHLPEQFEEEVRNIPNVKTYPANFTRSEIFGSFFSKADVLLHPSYMESFGMTILEALAHGLAIVSNDIYAIKEMVMDGHNGYLLSPPITKWSGVVPNNYFMQGQEFIDAIRDMDDGVYVALLADTILKISTDRTLLDRMKSNSLTHFNIVFKPKIGQINRTFY